MEIDWEPRLSKVKNRNLRILQSGNLADCRFLVGTSSNRRVISGHKLLLASASPVFEAMFYGSLAEKNDPILIPDGQPKAFAAMLDYIYADDIDICSFDHACDLYYLGKKYMLPEVYERCLIYLSTHLSPNNACRAYEFAKLYDETNLMECSMTHIAAFALEVINDPSFMDIEVSTLMEILDQNYLNIKSELNLFNCLVKFANIRGTLNEEDKKSITDAGSDNGKDFVVVEKNKLEPEDSSSGAASTSAEIGGNVSNVTDEDDVEMDCSNSADESEESIINIRDTKRTAIDEATLRQAVKKIRFLTMTPKEFAEGPARSKLLTRDEAISILINITTPNINNPMPEGFFR